jgi:hypothetical protein
MQRTDLAAADFAEAFRLDNSLDVPEEYRKRPTTVQGPAPPPTIQELTSPQQTPAPTPVAATPATTETKSDEPNAFELVAGIYEAEGFTVKKSSESEPNDLICTKAQESVHVKIKAVAHAGDPIHLAKAEVEQLKGQTTRTDLIITSAQSTDAKEANTDLAPRLHIVKRVVDWRPRAEELKPVEFEYQPEK